MQKPQVVAGFLVPPDPHAPEAMHPTMGAFSHPAPGLETSLFFEGLCFFPAGPDMRREATRLQEVPDLVLVISFLQAQPLGPGGRRVWPLRSDALDGGTCHLEIIPIRAVHGQTKRYATPVGEDAACGAELAAVRGMLAHLLPPQGGLWSSPRPSPALPSPCLARPHMLRDPVPRARRRRRPLPTLGNGDGRNYWNRWWSGSAHSTGTRCGAQKRWHPSLCDHRPGADGILQDAAYAGGARARCAPTMHQEYARHRGFAARYPTAAGLLYGK